MEPKLRIIRKKKSEAENAHLDPLMRALKALHSAGAPESMTAEELERQRRSQEVLGKLTAPMTGMDYEEFALSGMSAAWTRLKAPHGSRHAILYCHGGGYTSGNLGYSRVLSSKLAHATGYDVLSFEYRLAPEFPYPAAVEDALRAWDYLMLQGYGARDIVLAGDSAGGNLALVLCNRLKSGGPQAPRRAHPDVPVDRHDDVRPVLYRACGDRPDAHARVHRSRAPRLRRRKRLPFERPVPTFCRLHRLPADAHPGRRPRDPVFGFRTTLSGDEARKRSLPPAGQRGDVACVSDVSH